MLPKAPDGAAHRVKPGDASQRRTSRGWRRLTLWGTATQRLSSATMGSLRCPAEGARHARATGRNTMDVTIREAAEGDYDAPCDLFDGADRHNYALSPDAYDPPRSPARSRDYLTRIIAGDASSLLVAELAGDVVGLARVAVRSEPAMTAGMLAQVGYLYIDARVRGQGVGTAPLDGCTRGLRNAAAAVCTSLCSPETPPRWRSSVGRGMRNGQTSTTYCWPTPRSTPIR